MENYLENAFTALEGLDDIKIENPKKVITEAEEDEFEPETLRDLFEKAGAYVLTHLIRLEGANFSIFAEGLNEDGESLDVVGDEFDIEEIDSVLVELLDSENDFIGRIDKGESNVWVLDDSIESIKKAASSLVGFDGEDDEEHIVTDRAEVLTDVEKPNHLKHEDEALLRETPIEHLVDLLNDGGIECFNGGTRKDIHENAFDIIFGGDDYDLSQEELARADDIICGEVGEHYEWSKGRNGDRGQSCVVWFENENESLKENKVDIEKALLDNGFEKGECVNRINGDICYYYYNGTGHFPEIVARFQDKFGKLDWVNERKREVGVKHHFDECVKEGKEPKKKAPITTAQLRKVVDSYNLDDIMGGSLDEQDDSINEIILDCIDVVNKGGIEPYTKEWDELYALIEPLVYAEIRRRGFKTESLQEQKHNKIKASLKEGLDEKTIQEIADFIGGDAEAVKRDLETPEGRKELINFITNADSDITGAATDDWCVAIAKLDENLTEGENFEKVTDYKVEIHHKDGNVETKFFDTDEEACGCYDKVNAEGDIVKVCRFASDSCEEEKGAEAESLKESHNPTFSELEEWCQGDVVEMLKTIERIRKDEMNNGDVRVFMDFGFDDLDDEELEKVLGRLEDEVYSYLYDSGDFTEEQIAEIEGKLGESCKKKVTESVVADLGDKEQLEKAEEILNKPEEDHIEQIVDINADTVDDLKKTYIGSAILQCRTCKTLIYKDPSELVKDEENDGDVYNKGEECPHCGDTQEGYDLIGQVAKLDVDTEEQPEPPMEETEVEETEETTEETTEEGGLDNIAVGGENTEEKGEETEEKGITTIETESLIGKDFDDERFNVLATKYLNEIYNNVKDFKTTTVSADDLSKVVIEGVITFKSGKEKKTTFTFNENKVKANRIKLVGLNETFSKDKAFVLLGTMKDHNIIAESLSYSYLNNNKKVKGKVNY